MYDDRIMTIKKNVYIGLNQRDTSTNLYNLDLLNRLGRLFAIGVVE